MRITMEVICKVNVKVGMKDAVKGMKDVIEFGGKHRQNDAGFGKIIGDFAELLIEAR